MAQENSNSTMEMGTSDQVLVATKKKNKLTFVIGGVVMLAIVVVSITLVVVLSNTNGGVAEPIVSPTPPDTTTPTTTTTSTTTSSTTSTTESTTEGPPPPDGPPRIELEDIINGVYATPAFNGTWTSGKDILLRNENGDLVLYDVDTDSSTVLVRNTSEVLQLSSRVTDLSPDGNHVALAINVAPLYRYSFLARYVVVDIFNGNVTEVLPPTDVRSSDDDKFLQNFVWGPSGTTFAYVFRNDIYYQAELTEEPQRITSDGEPNVIYNGIPDWVYEEEVFVSNNALWFSADGSRLAYARFDDSAVRVMQVPHYGVPGSVNYQYTTHHKIRYPKPGTTNPTVSVTLQDLNSLTSYTYTEPTDIDQPILKSVRFVNNNAVALMWTNRVQNVLIVNLCTFGSTTCTRIYETTEENGWIDNIPLIFNEAGNAFITILPQLVSGSLFKQIVKVTQPSGEGTLWTASNRVNTAHTVGEILVWTNSDVIWYKATHVNDSAEQHIYTVNSSGEVACFTCNIERGDGGRCLFNDAVLSKDTDRITINCAGPDLPQVYIYDVNGTLVKVWNDNSETAASLQGLELPTTIRLSMHVADGLPRADVQIYAPADYEQRNNVPLLVYVYGGPDTALVTKQWNIDWGTSLVSRWGIAVAQIDGRGSGLRGVENLFAVNRQLGTVEIEDQINVTKYLHERFPWLDSNRTCIWGWSYGGYASSLALARGGPTFRCAIAVAPVVDWRFYDTIYTERYLDVPQNNSLGYAQSSLLTDDVVSAFRSKRYMLVHGTADDNVHYQHAMLLSRLLQRYDVYFTQMSYTDEDHALDGVRPHLYHSLERFLQENML